jgi:thymidylate kinase
VTTTLVVIEGLTGSGKSTIADALALRRGYLRPSLIPGEWKAAHALLEDDPEGLDARYALFIAAILHLATVTVRALDNGTSVVLDSWHYRTVATHESLGSSLSWTIPTWVPRPDVAVFLDLDESLRRERIERRARPSGYWKTQCELHSSSIKNRYRELAPDMHWIDSSAPVDEIVNRIEELIRE